MTHPVTATGVGRAPATVARAERTPQLFARSGCTIPVLSASVMAQTGIRGTLTDTRPKDTATVGVAASAAELNSIQS